MGLLVKMKPTVVTNDDNEDSNDDKIHHSDGIAESNDDQSVGFDDKKRRSERVPQRKL